MSERHGVEVDYCPQCRGVWLDRGELDKITERAGREWGAPPRAPQPVQSAPPPRHAQYGDPYHGKYRHKRKKSFLDDLFDF
jgi:Uncharacterized protein conserved in bacteria